MTFFILPAVALLTLTWVYFVPSLFLYAGVMIFIGTEEEQLTKAFGKEYEDYLSRVDRLVPLKNLDFWHVLSHARTGQQQLKMIRKALLVFGILSSLIWLGTDILAALRYEGYSYPFQPISALSAIGAPTRPFVIPLLNVYVVLKIAFALGVWMSAGQKRTLRITAVLLFAWGVTDLAAYFFPWNPGENVGTLTNIMHAILAGGVTVLLILLTIGFGAGAEGKWFRFYSYGTLLVLIVSGGVMAFLDSPRIEANQAPPWFGVTERIDAYSFMLWMVLLAIVLLRIQPDNFKREDRERIIHPIVNTQIDHIRCCH